MAIRNASITLFVGATLLACSALQGQEDLVVGQLDTFVVTPSRADETWIDTPYTVEQLLAEDLVESAARSLPEALEFTPGVVIQKTGHGQGSPIIRGLTGYHNLLLIDGIRLNNAAFRSGPNQYWNTVDSQGLSSVELVKSQGSVLYGGDAAGGTLQAFTSRPFYAEDGGLHAGGRSYSRYATGEDSFIQRGEVSLSEAGKWGLILGGTAKDFGDIRAAGLGRLPKTGYGEWDVDGKFELFLNPDTRLTVFHQQVHIDDAWRVHKTRFAKSWRGAAVGDENARILDQTRMLSYVQLDSAASSPFFDHYTLSLSHQRHGEERFRERSDHRTDIQGFELDSYGLWAQFDRELEFTSLTYGASYYQDRLDSFRSDFNADGSLKARRIQGPVGDDGVYHLVGAYLNSVTPVGERLTLDLGARYTYSHADIGAAESSVTGERIAINNEWDSMVGSGRLSYQLDDAGELKLFGGVSQAFRAPNFSDLSRFDSNRSAEIETPAPNLDPEQFVTFELGLKAETGRFSGSLAYFFTDVSDLILRSPTGRIVEGLDEVTKLNSGDGYIQGVELSGALDLGGGWSIVGGFAYQDSLVSTFPTSDPVLRDEVLSRLMPTNGHGGLRWESNDGDLSVEALVQAVGPGDRLSTRDRRDLQRIPPGGTPSYWLATVRGSCQLRENMRITAAVENAFDEEYRAHGSGQNEPGVNFVFGAEITF